VANLDVPCLSAARVTLILTALRTSAEQTLVNLGIDLNGFQTHRNLHAGLLAALQIVEPTKAAPGQKR